MEFNGTMKITRQLYYEFLPFYNIVTCTKYRSRLTQLAKLSFKISLIDLLSVEFVGNRRP